MAPPLVVRILDGRINIRRRMRQQIFRQTKKIKVPAYGWLCDKHRCRFQGHSCNRLSSAGATWCRCNLWVWYLYVQLKRIISISPSQTPDRREFTYSHVTRASERNEFWRENAFLRWCGLLFFSIPLLYPQLQVVQSRFDASHTEVIPKPSSNEAQDRVKYIARIVGIKSRHQLLVELVYDAPEFRFGNSSRIQDLRVKIRKGGSKITLEKPVAADSDYPRLGIFCRV